MDTVIEIKIPYSIDYFCSYYRKNKCSACSQTFFRRYGKIRTEKVARKFLYVPEISVVQRKIDMYELFLYVQILLVITEICWQLFLLEIFCSFTGFFFTV